MRSKLEAKKRAIAQRYTNNEVILNAVLARLDKLTFDEDDPFTEYNILILVVLEEMKILKDEQLYHKMLDITTERWQKMERNIASLFTHSTKILIVCCSLGVILSFIVGVAFGWVMQAQKGRGNASTQQGHVVHS